ncbi:MAG: AAA family ATPase, partial [Polyangiaceae bacterium]|nr:AAA family ATPase [Polyangiaceae bacterium]
FFPPFKCFDTVPSQCVPGAHRVVWRAVDTNDLYAMENMPDGFRRFLCLVTLLLQPFARPESPRLIVLDQPELNLTPGAIELVALRIMVASRNAQIIVCTESQDLVGWLTRPDYCKLVE